MSNKLSSIKTIKIFNNLNIDVISQFDKIFDFLKFGEFGIT